MAQSQFTVTFSFDGANQTLADNKRDAAIVDFCKMNGLAFAPAATALANCRQQTERDWKFAVIRWRVDQTRQTTQASEEAALNP